MFKKACSLFLVIVFCLGCMTACFGNDSADKPVATQPETEAETLPPPVKLPEQTDVLDPGKYQGINNLNGIFEGKDYTGLSFSVIIAEDSGLDIDSESELSYSRALQIQCDIIGDALGCEVYVNRTPYTTFMTDATWCSFPRRASAI